MEEFKTYAVVGITESGKLSVESNIEDTAQIINLLAEGIQVVVIGDKDE